MTTGRTVSIASVFALALLGALFVPLANAQDPAFGSQTTPTAQNGPFFDQTLLPGTGFLDVGLMIPFTPGISLENDDTFTATSPGYHKIAVTIPDAHLIPAGPAAAIKNVELCPGVVDGAAPALAAPACLDLEASACAGMGSTNYCVLENPAAGDMPDGGEAFDRDNTALITLGRNNNVFSLRVTLEVQQLLAPGDEEFHVNLRGNWLPAVNNAHDDALLVTGPLALLIEEPVPTGAPARDRTITADDEDQITLCAGAYSAADARPSSRMRNLEATWSGAGSGEFIGPNPAECIIFNGEVASGTPRSIVATAYSVASAPVLITVTAGKLVSLEVECPATAPAGSTVPCALGDALDGDGNAQDVEVTQWHAHDGDSDGAGPDEEDDLVILPDGTFTAPEDADDDPVHVHAHARSLTPASDDIESNEVSIDVIPAALAIVLATDMPGGVGSEIGDVPVTADGGFSVYCSGFDEFMNFIADVVCDWHVDDGIGTVTPAQGTSTAFDPTTIGEGHVHGEYAADHTLNDETGHITVTAGALADFVVSCSPSPATVGTSSSCSAANGVDANGNAQTIGAVTWTAVDSALSAVTIDTNGQFTAPTDVSLGPVTVTGASGSANDDESVPLSAGALATIEVTCTPNPADVGGTSTCSATGRDAFNNPTTAGPISWSAVDAALNPVTIDGNGVLTAPNLVSAGPVVVTGQAVGGITDTDSVALQAGPLAAFDVSCTPNAAPLGSTVNCFVSNGRDAFTNARTIGTPTWTATDAASGSVAIDNTGVFTSPTDISKSPISVRADVGAVFSTTSVNLAAGALATITVSCVANPATVGDSVTCTAAGADAFSNPTATGPLTWTALDAALNPVSISGAGVFTAPNLVADGPIAVHAEVTATPTIDDDESVALQAAALAAITVTCTDNPAVVGSNVDCSATGADAFGNPQATGVLDWTATDAASNAVTISGTGDFTAPNLVADGPIAVHAEVNGNSLIDDDESVALAAAALQAFTTTCTPNPAGAGVSVTCTVGSGVDVHGNPRAVGAVTWSATDATTAPVAIDSSGVFTAPSDINLAPITVRATGAGAVFDEDTVGLEAGPLHHFDVACPASLAVAASGACTAVAKDAVGNSRSDVPTSWVATAGSFTGSGLAVTYFAPTTTGTTTVTASLGLVTGTDDVLVTPGALATLTMSLASGNTLDVSADDASAVVTATGRDSFGNLVADGTTVYWTLSDPGAANVGAGAGLGAASSATTAGVASVTLTTSTTPGDDYRIRADNDAVDPTVTRNSGTFRVGPGALEHFTITCATTCTVAGDAFNVNVRAYDQFNNQLSAAPNLYTGSHTLVFGGATAAPDGDVPQCGGADLGTGASVSFTAGLATVSCTLYRAQSATLSVSEGTILSGAGLGVSVDPDDAAKLVFVSPASSMIAGDCTAFTIQVRDQFGNAQPAGAFMVTLGGWGLGSFYNENTCTTSTTMETIADGASTLDVWFADTSAQNLGFTADAATLTQGATNFVVDPAAAHHFDLSGAAGSIAGNSVSVGLVAEDTYGNVLNAGPNLYAGSKTITFGGATAAPAGNVPQCGGVNLGTGVSVSFALGAATVSCTFTNAQNVAVQATDGSIVESATLAVTVDPAAVGALLMTAPGQTFEAASGTNSGTASGQVAGASFNVVLRALDAYNNVVDSGTNDFDGAKDLGFAGANAAFTTEAPTAAATNFGTTTAVTFNHGTTGNVAVVLYRRETALLTVASVPTGPATAASTSIAVAADTAGTDLGVLNCNPALNNRACILKSQTVSSTLNAVVGNDYSLRAGKFDAYDNIAGGLVVGWASTGGVSPDQSGQTASSIIFSPDAAGTGTITVAKAGFNGDTPLALDVVVT